MKTCNSCGAEMNDNDRFCMQCGKDQTVSVETKVCNSCGAEMNAKDRFCMACGKDQTVDAAPAAEEVKAAEPQPTPVVETVTPAPAPTYTDSTYSYTDTSVSDAGDGKATASMVCGIVGLVLCGCMPLGVAALICGILAKKDGSTSGKATAGIIMGAIILVLWVISLILNIATGTFADLLNQL